MSNVQVMKQQMASKQHPTIRAVIDQKYRLPDLESAEKRLKTLKKHFVHSKEQSDDRLALRLWIRDFAVTTPEKKKGFLGNFAMIRIRKTSEGYYLLTAEKERVELKKHPQRRRPKQSHPDWGHPILRSIHKGATYHDIETAQAKLDRLHEEFSKVTIPTVGALHVIIYGAQKDSDAKTHKFTLQIEATQEGEFVIVAKRNERPARPQMVRQEASPSLVKGQFTAQVLLNKTRKQAA